MLRADRASYLLDYEMPAFTQNSTEKPDEMLHSLTIKEMPIFFMVSKNAPQPERLLKAVHEGYLSVMAERDKP